MVELILNSGSIGIGIGALFVLALGLFIERFLVYRKATVELRSFSDEFEEAIGQGNLQLAKDVCEKHGGMRGAHVPEVYLIAVEHINVGPATLRNVLDNHIELMVVPRLRRGLGLLATIARTAPMLGLIGTVAGMIGAFSTIAGEAGAGVDPKALAGDIGMALGTTFLGLLVAIPVVFGVTYLKAKVEQFEVDLDRYSQKCLDLLCPSSPMSIASATVGGV